MILKLLAVISNAFPAARRGLWRFWYQIVSRKYTAEDFRYMNYGYAPLDPAEPRLQLEAADEKDRACIQLYDQVASTVPLAGKRVLEVGSGRGGGADYIARTHKPARMVGVDYSSTAVELCAKTYSTPNLQFKQGDAENLPLAEGEFDVVINVESSHCYGSMANFAAQVFRVLAPGGHFVWTDFRTKAEIETAVNAVLGAGFTLVSRRVISPNVVEALEMVGEAKAKFIAARVPRFLRSKFEQFAGSPGSIVHTQFKSGEGIYLLCCFAKGHPRTTA